MLQNILLIITVISIVFSHAYKSGAPPDVCDHMTPEHGVPPQPFPSPYIINLDKTRVKSGSKVIVSIVSTNESFKGFFLQARDEKNNTIGTFDKVPNTKLVNCNLAIKNAITHSNSNDKSNISIPWTAPNGIKNQKINFILTVAKNGGEFWVGQKSGVVIII